MSDRAIPTTITSDKLVKACSAFMEALGINPNLVYFPLVVTSDRVDFPSVVTSDYECEVPEATGVAGAGYIHPQDDELGELSIMCTIKVNDDA